MTDNKKFVFAPVAAFRGTPVLDHDIMMSKTFRGGAPLNAHQRLERRIVYALCMHMQMLGFRVSSVWDGEECTSWTDEQCPLDTVAQRTASAKQAMELIFNLDEVSLRFRPKNAEPITERGGMNQFADCEHGVLLVLGNGLDIICDWNYSDDDADGFDAAMNRFDTAIYA